MCLKEERAALDQAVHELKVHLESTETLIGEARERLKKFNDARRTLLREQMKRDRLFWCGYCKQIFPITDEYPLPLLVSDSLPGPDPQTRTQWLINTCETCAGKFSRYAQEQKCQERSVYPVEKRDGMWGWLSGEEWHPLTITLKEIPEHIPSALEKQFRIPRELMLHTPLLTEVKMEEQELWTY